MGEWRSTYFSDDEQGVAEFDGDDFPYGLHHDYAENLATLSVTGATPVSYLLLTTGQIPAGNYKICWSGLWSTSAQNGSAIIDVEVDGTLIWESEDNGSRSGRKTFSGFAVVNLPDDADTHTIEILLGQIGPGNSSIFQGNISLERWD